MKKKRKCKKGYSCGSSCINVKLECRKGLNGQSVNIADRLANLLAIANASSEQEPKKETRDNTFTINPQKPDSNEVKLGQIFTFYGKSVIESLVNTDDGPVQIESFIFEEEDTWEVAFRVDGQFSTVKRPNLTPEDRKLISKTINYDVQRLLQRLPDFARLINEPHMSDGKHKARARLYERYGFGKMIEGTQYAIKDGNTIKPQNEAFEFSETSLNNTENNKNTNNMDDIDQLIYDILFGDDENENGDEEA